MNHHLNNCFTTGEFAKACNITKQTLFHYDAIGLLTPHFKDEKGYRYYSYQQFDLLYVINILKEMKQQDKTVIIVTHDQSIAQQCDRVIQL